MSIPEQVRVEAAAVIFCFGCLVSFWAGATLRNNPEPRVIMERCQASVAPAQAYTPQWSAASVVVHPDGRRLVNLYDAHGGWRVVKEPSWFQVALTEVR